MLRTIKLTIDPVVLDPNSTLKHIGSSYQVGPDTTFAIANLFVNRVNDRVNLTEYTFTHDIQPKQPVYIRTRYHFNNGTASSWSNIIPLYSDQVGLKPSDTVISTPTISAELDYTNTTTGEIFATVSNFQLYSGVGVLDSVTWLITSTNGELIYEVPKSKSLLTSIRLPISILNGNSSFIVSARLHSNTNTTSNQAKTLVVVKRRPTAYFKAVIKDTLYSGTMNYILVTEHNVNYVGSEVRILASDGTTFATYTNLDAGAPAFNVGSIDLAGYYIVEVRTRTAAGTFTPWTEVYRGAPSKYDVRLYSTSISYINRMGFGSYIDFPGMSGQMIQADGDGVFYLGVPGANRLDAYKSKSGRIYPIGISMATPGPTMAGMPSVALLKQYDGGYLLDYSMQTHLGKSEVPTFVVMRYNRITKELVKIKSYIRPDERLSTGRSNSAVTKRDGTVWYVPAMMVDAAGTQLDLELRVYDTVTNNIIDHIPLPVTGLKENVTISEDANGDIYMAGGSSGPVKNALHGEVVNTLINKRVYKLDPVTKTWTVLAGYNPNASSYRMNMQTLRNGSILLYDATPGIVGSGNRISWVYNPVNNTFGTAFNNNPLQERIGVTIELPDGDVCLMSSTPETVEMYSYVRTTISNALVSGALQSASQPVANLVVPSGQTVFIRDPYRYASIVIQGTNLTNSGKLVWIENNVPTTYYYNDLIVTRNLSIPAATPTVPQPTYNRLIVVGDAILTIN